jgi:outer membrane protein TolC
MRTTREVVLAIALLALTACGARAQAARELTADESVRLGLERNARLQAARFDVAAAEASRDQVRAGLLPAIRSQGSYTRLSQNIPPVQFTLPGTDSSITFQAVEFNRWSGEVSLEQPIFAGFRLRNQLRAASEDARAAELTGEQERADVALEIRRAYWSLYRAMSVRGAVDASLRQVDDLLKDVRNRVAAGTALRRDLLAAETRRSEVQLERVEAENAVRVGQLELNRLIGLPLDTPVLPTGTVQVDTATTAGALQALTQAALSGRPQLAAQAATVQGLRAQLRAVEGGRLPELSFLARYMYARPNPYFFEDQNRFRGTWEIGFSAHLSLWEGGRAGAQVAEARARLLAAEARLADAREQVAVNVARQQLEVVRAGDAVDAATSNVAAAEESFRVARQQYGEGVALSSEVLDAEQAARRAQANRAGALADYAVARATLLDVLGRVW